MDVANEVVDLWFSDEVRPLHFAKSEDFDNKIKAKFQPVYEEAKAGKYDSLTQSAKGSLALVILFDQFPRNMFRDDARSFEGDQLARKISRQAIDAGYANELTTEQCAFLYMPFMHSEDLDEQNYSVDLYDNLGVESNFKFAVAHRDIIQRFGRFPHRNNVLGRQSTDDEVEFLQGPNSSF